MKRLGPTSVRCVCLVLALILAALPQMLQPSQAGAAAALTINKAACNVSTGGGCATTVSASAGNVVQYILNYSTAGADVPTNVTLTDQLQAGQVFLSCSSPTTPAGAALVSCTANGANPPLITATINNVAPNSTGTIAIQVQIAGTANPVSNTFSGSASSTTGQPCPQGYQVDPTTPGRCREPAPSAAACTYPGSIYNAGYCYVVTGSYTQTFTTGPSNTTTVTLGTTPPPPLGACLSVGKTVRDVTRGDNYTTAEYAYPGDLIRYRITVTNGCGTTATAVSVTDTIQAGQTFGGAGCNPAACSYSGSTVAFPLGDLTPGATATVYFDVNVGGCCAQAITNAASASGTNATAVTSNTTTVTLLGPGGPPPTNYPPPVTYPGPVGYPFPATGTVLICGVVTAYTAAASGAGYMTINGETFNLMPYLVPAGPAVTIGVSFCFALTLNVYSQVTAVLVSPNVAGVNYACGGLNQFTPGYYPFNGFAPYPGYTPYPAYGQYPGYGPYQYPGNPQMWGYGGPMMIGGYPFQVSPGTTFTNVLTYGNPYCFLMNNTGYVTGSLSTVVTAATPVTSPAGVHRSGRHLAL